MTLVSVITPTYNRHQLLQEAIQSVRAQTFLDWEMLIVDDGSESSPQPVVDAFNDPRLRYIQLPRAGRSAARNRGLELARGAYVGFLDDDDLYHPDKLARELACIRSNPHIDIVGSGYQLVSNAGEVLTIYEHWRQRPEITIESFLVDIPLATCSVLVSRDAIDRMDRWFDPTLNYWEDADFFRRLFLNDVRFMWLKEILSDYRRVHARPWPIPLQAQRDGWRALDTFLQRGDLPPDIVVQRRDILAKFDLQHAWMAYSHTMPKVAQRFLMEALMHEPELANERADFLLKNLAIFSQSQSHIDNPKDYVEYVLAHLPLPLSYLIVSRAEAQQLITAAKEN